MGWLHDYTPDELNSQYESEQRSIREQNVRREFLESGFKKLLRLLKESRNKWHVFDILPDGVTEEIVRVAIDRGYVIKKAIEKKQEKEKLISIVGFRITAKGQKELTRLELPKSHEERFSRIGA